MLKNFSQLKTIVNDKEGFFQCEIDTPLYVAKEMILQCLKYIGQVEDQIKSQQNEAKAKADAEIKEEPKPEEV